MNSNDLCDQCSPEHCATDAFSTLMDKIAKSFKHRLAERKLKPGTLLCFSSSSVHQSYACLLGVTQKKPILQTLLHVVFHENGDILFKSTDGIPEVSTSCELFRKFAGKDPNSIINIDVQVWRYSMKWIDNHLLTACAEELVDQFIVSSTPDKQRPSIQPKMLAKLKASIRRRMPKKMPLGFRKQAKPKAKPTSKRCHGSDSEASSNAKRDDHGRNTLDLDAEANPVDPISDTVASEERIALNLEKEIAVADATKETIVERINEEKGLESLRKGSTFFSKSIGLEDTGFAASGRSVCLYCKGSIRKNDVRYSWYHNRLRPPGWLHAECLYQQATAANLKTETRAKLAAISERSFSSSESRLQAEAVRVLNAFAGD